MSDILNQIETDLRTENLRRFWKENGNWIIGGALGAVLLTGVLAGYRTWDYNRDLKSTEALVAATQAGDAASLEAFAATADAKHAALARLRAAELHLARGEDDKALALYDTVAATRGADIWRDLAALHAAALRLDTEDPIKLAKQLIPLNKSPWRYTALELQALLAAREGKMDTATLLLGQIADDPHAPQDARRRALSLRSLYAAEPGRKS